MTRDRQTRPCQKDAPRFDVQIHQVVGNATLQIAVDMAYDHLRADVDDFKVRQVRLRDALVRGLVLADAVEEISQGLLVRHVLVVGIASGHFKRNIRGDDFGIIAP